MFKRLLQTRHDAPSKEVGGPPPPRYAYGTNGQNNTTVGFDPLSFNSKPCSVGPVEYNRESPHYRPVGSANSINPVEYRQSPVGPPAPGAPPSSAFSINPVEYRQSPFPPGAPGAPRASSTESPIPIDYRASAPMPTPRQPAQPKIVETPHR